MQLSKLSHKLLFLGILDLILCLSMFLFVIPHSSLSEDFFWQADNQTVQADVVMNGDVYSTMISQQLTDNLPKGSYTLTITVNGASDNDLLQVQGASDISSIYSNSVSVALSQYGTTYSIPFENPKDGNAVSLCYSQFKGLGRNISG